MDAPAGISRGLNGFKHDFTTNDAFDLVIGVAEGRLELVDIAAELRAHMVPLAG